MYWATALSAEVQPSLVTTVRPPLLRTSYTALSLLGLRGSFAGSAVAR